MISKIIGNLFFGLLIGVSVNFLLFGMFVDGVFISIKIIRLVLILLAIHYLWRKTGFFKRVFEILANRDD